MLADGGYGFDGERGKTISTAIFRADALFLVSNRTSCTIFVPALDAEVWRYRILMKRTCGFWERRQDLGAAMKAIQSAVLLDKLQVQFLFPDSEIVSEKVFGLTKSLIAIRR